MNERPIRATVAIPVYNGEDSLERAAASALAQRFDSFELLIVDNASTDRTEEICRALVKQDARVRYIRNAENIGLLSNFNKTVEESKGEHLRWLGSHDHLYPDYLAECVAALDANPRASIATCHQEYFDLDGRRAYAEYDGPRPDGGDVVARLGCLLKLLRSSYLYFDPIYSLIRRTMLSRTAGLPRMLHADRVLAADLCLVGPYCHVPRCLAARFFPGDKTDEQLLKIMAPEQSPPRSFRLQACREIAACIDRQPLSQLDKRRCKAKLAHHFVAGSLAAFSSSIRPIIGRATGLRYVKQAFTRCRSRHHAW